MYFNIKQSGPSGWTDVEPQTSWVARKIPNQGSHSRGCMWGAALGQVGDVLGPRIGSKHVWSFFLNRCLGKYFVYFHSFLQLYFHHFISHACPHSTHICPTSHSPLDLFVSHRSNFPSLFLLKPFRKTMKKPRRSQKKDSLLLGTCCSRTGFTATITESYRLVQTPRLGPASSDHMLGLRALLGEEVRVSLWNPWPSQGTSLRKDRNNAKSPVATTSLPSFRIMKSNA